MTIDAALQSSATDDIPEFSRYEGDALRCLCSNELGEFGPEIKVTPQMVYGFADLTGDRNPLHTDIAAAKLGPFGDRVAHGALIVCLWPRLRPAPRFRIRDAKPVNLGGKQRYLAPVYFSQRVRARERLDKVRVTGPGTIMIHTFQVWNIDADKPAAECEVTLMYS